MNLGQNRTGGFSKGTRRCDQRQEDVRVQPRQRRSSIHRCASPRPFLLAFLGSASFPRLLQFVSMATPASGKFDLSSVWFMKKSWFFSRLISFCFALIFILIFILILLSIGWLLSQHPGVEIIRILYRYPILYPLLCLSSQSCSCSVSVHGFLVWIHSHKGFVLFCFFRDTYISQRDIMLCKRQQAASEVLVKVTWDFW